MTHNNPQSFFLRMLMVAVAVMMAVGVLGQDVRVGRYEQLKSMRGKDLVMLGLKYLNERNMPDSALLCFTLQANKRYDKVAQKDKDEMFSCVDALRFLGQVYYDYYSDYQKAYGYYYLAEECCRKHNIHLLLPYIHNNMAGLTLLKGNADNNIDTAMRAIREFKNAYDESLQYDNGTALGYTAINMASTSLTWCLIDSVKDVLTSFVKMKKNPRNKRLPYQCDACQAVLEYHEKHVDKALFFFDQALSKVYNDNAKMEALDSTIINDLKMRVLFFEGRDEEAMSTAEKNIKIAERADLPVCFFDTYKILHDHYKEMGNEKLATKYELLYLRKKDFIVNKSKLADMEQTKFLLEINELNKEAEAMAIRDRMKSWMLWMVSGFALLIVCLLIFLYLKYKQVKENHRLLYLKSLDMIRTDEEKRQLIEKLEAQIRQYEELEKKEAAHEVHRMDEEKMTNLLHRIFMVMETSEEVYSKDFSMNRLAELVDDTRNNVSEAINRQYKTGFYDLLNEYRVKEACRRMNDFEHYGHLTIEYISSELGFKSRTTFIAAFKKMVGLTPSAYLKLAKER